MRMFIYPPPPLAISIAWEFGKYYPCRKRNNVHEKFVKDDNEKWEEKFYIFEFQMKQKEKLFLNLYIYFHFWVNFTSLNQNESTYFSVILSYLPFECFSFFTQCTHFQGTIRNRSWEISFLLDFLSETTWAWTKVQGWKNKKIYNSNVRYQRNKKFTFIMQIDRECLLRENPLFYKFSIFFPSTTKSSYYVKVENITQYRGKSSQDRYWKINKWK